MCISNAWEHSIIQGSWETIRGTPLVIIGFEDARMANLMAEKGIVTYASIAPFTNHLKVRCLRILSQRISTVKPLFIGPRGGKEEGPVNRGTW